MTDTFEELSAPPDAIENGGIEVLRASVVDGTVSVALRRSFGRSRHLGRLLIDPRPAGGAGLRPGDRDVGGGGLTRASAPARIESLVPENDIFGRTDCRPSPAAPLTCPLADLPHELTALRSP